jgi:hypothetical protein
MTKKSFLLLALVALMVAAASAVAAAASKGDTSSSSVTVQKVITAKLKQVHGSGVHGTTRLRQISGDGTRINVTAKDLKPHHRYVSLYYDNHRCHLEPYSQEDIIGRYRANNDGVGQTAGKADDKLEEINSVSVRLAKNFKLLACANVHPR